MIKSRLVRFLLILVLLLVGLELFVRANRDSFYALSDKMLLKVKILEREPDTKILFLGSSRFLDGIDHQRFTKELKSITGVKLKSLNAATSGLQSERLAYFSEIAAQNQGLTHVILETAAAMGSGGKLNLPGEDPEPTQGSGDDMRFPDRFEKSLQTWLVDHVALVTYRKALRPKTVVKLFVLYTANLWDPNIWSRKRPLEAIFLPADEKVTPSIIANYQPTVIEPTSIPDSTPKNDATFERMRSIAKIFEGSNMKVIWVAPPVSKQQSLAIPSEKYTQYYQSLANETGSTFYNYAAEGWDEKYLKDSSHLNSSGRSLFTKVLAAHLKDQFPPEKTAN